MMTSSISHLTRRIASVGALLLLLGISTREASAQFDQKAMAVGDLHHVYTETGGQQEYWYGGGDLGVIWEGIYQRGYLRADALWIGVKNFTDEEGRTWPAKVVHVGPRVTGFGEFFPQEFQTIQRFEDPVVTVDGLESLDKAADVDEVDPSIPSDRIIRTVVNTQTGITMEKRVLGWSQEHHDDYHVQEYVLTNTGNTDEDEEVELDQPAEDVYLHFQRRYVFQDNAAIPGSGWGANVMNDIVGDGMDDYEVDFRAAYTWLGNSQNADIDPLGGPARDDSPGYIPQGDDQGQLTQAVYAGVVTLHADTGPNDQTDDPNQPSMTGHIDADDPITSGNDPFNESQMEREYTFMSEARPAENNGPHMFPHHADLVDLDGDFTTADGAPMIGKAGGWTSAWSYGPYDLAPGESVRIVMAEAVDGFTRQEQVRLGRAFKANGFDPEAPIEIDADHNGTIEPDERMGKNDWVVNAGKDSLFQTFEKAIANYESGYSIPHPPLPPKSFSVTSGVDQIELSWTKFEGANPPGGFEIYRTRNFVIGDWRDLYQYQRIATVDASTTSYVDDEVARGINYYYYIVSVGAPNTDGTAMTPTGRPLRSSRYWTQTYDPASLKRPPGETTSSFKVVPNPYNIASDPNVRWPGQQDQVGFLDVPGNCVIRIYTELGELVRTIRHDDGSGDEFWDLTTEDRQLVASGIYIAVVENLDNNDQSVKKFVIIR